MGSCSSKSRVTPISKLYKHERVNDSIKSLDDLLPNQVGRSSFISSLRSSSNKICDKQSVKWGCITSDEGSTVMISPRFEEEDCDDYDSASGSHCHDFDMFCQSQRRLTLSYQSKVEVPDDFQLSSDDLSDDLSDVSNSQKYMNRRTTV